MEKIDKAIDWSRVESILMGHYVVGTSPEGADALAFAHSRHREYRGKMV